MGVGPCTTLGKGEPSKCEEDYQGSDRHGTYSEATTTE